MGRVCHGPSLYGPSLLWAEFVMGRVCMGRVCYGPSLSWAEFVMGRVVQLPWKGQGESSMVRIFHNIVACEAFYVHSNIVIYLERRKTVPEEL